MNLIRLCLIRPTVLHYTTTSRTTLAFPSKKRAFSTLKPPLRCQGRLHKNRFGVFLKIRSSMSSSTSLELSEKQVHQVDRILEGRNDEHGGVIVEMTAEPLDPVVFASLLKASLAQWRQQGFVGPGMALVDHVINQGGRGVGFEGLRPWVRSKREIILPGLSGREGKRGIWIKMPIELVNLVEPAVKEGFYFHHAEPKYLMLAHWLPSMPNILPANASHRVSVGAFILNEKNEVLVVQEKYGKFSGTGIWKFPTGVVDEGEDICDAAVREVKEETGVDTKFLEVLAFRQSHRSYFQKSDLFFVCMLQPLSSDIQPQEAEIEAAQWMPYEEYLAQPIMEKHDLLRKIADICAAKKGKGYSGFTPVQTTTSFSNKESYLYLNNRDVDFL